MTGVFEVLAADESVSRVASRKALVLAETRINERLGKWFQAATTPEAYDAYFSYAKDEFEGIVRVACEEVGHSDSEAIANTLHAHFRPSEPRTASVHEARKPKMCPYHSEVVDISLSSDDPQAGYSAMASHAWGPQHCQAQGYEGKCNFKRDMVTKSYWDDRAKALDEKRQQREEQPQELFQTEAPVTEIPQDTIDQGLESGGEDIVAPEMETFEAPVEEAAPVSEFSLAMASKIAHITPLVQEEGDNSSDGQPAAPKGQTHKAAAEENPSNQDDKGKTVPCPVCGGDGESNSGKTCSRCAGKGRVADWGESTLDKVAGDGNTDLGGPEPKMDKAKWTPQNVKEIPDDSKYNPTRRKDPIEPIKAVNADELTEIGEQTTERVELDRAGDDGSFSPGGEDKGPATQTFPKGTHEVEPVTQKTEASTSFLDLKVANQFIKERGGKWVVIKHSDGSVISTHDSKEKAEASFKAMMMHKGKTADYEHQEYPGAMGYGQYPGDNDDQRAYDHYNQTGEKATLYNDEAMRNCPACMGQSDYHVPTGELPEHRDELIAPVDYQPIHHGKTAAGGGPSFPPQQPLQGQTPPAMPYNPAAVEESLGLQDQHPAVQYAYERAIQQGANPQTALQNARDMQGQMGQQAIQGIQQPDKVPYMGKAEDVNSNPIVDLMESDFDGFIPQSTVQRVTSALSK